MENPSQVKTLTEVLIGMSWLAIIFAIYGYVGGDNTTVLNIAATQWLLISAILGINAIFFRVSIKK